ncbi:MAG: hypothetical protein U0414_09090 [Polyangiaceae bacterium]
MIGAVSATSAIDDPNASARAWIKGAMAVGVLALTLLVEWMRHA